MNITQLIMQSARKETELLIKQHIERSIERLIADRYIAKTMYGIDMDKLDEFVTETINKYDEQFKAMSELELMSYMMDVIRKGNSNV